MSSPLSPTTAHLSIHLKNLSHAGHSLLGMTQCKKLLLTPQGQTSGPSQFLPHKDPTLISKQQIFARIVGGLGGHAAKEVVLGESEVTTGAAGDPWLVEDFLINPMEVQ